MVIGATRMPPAAAAASAGRLRLLLAVAVATGIGCAPGERDSGPPIASKQRSAAQLASSCDAGVVFSSPLKITAGGTYSGNWESTDSAVPALEIHTTEPVTIVNSVLRGPGNLMVAWGWGLSNVGIEPAAVKVGDANRTDSMTRPVEQVCDLRSVRCRSVDGFIVCRPDRDSVSL